MPLFLKNMPKCVFILDRLKRQCRLLYFGEVPAVKKKLAGRMWFHSKGCIFLYIIVFSSPAVV